jgi:cytoplasmic iron level regulating protein YaaA (DUF328/UPF0246 family)
MLAVLSPAKTLDMTPPAAALSATSPSLMKDAEQLMKTARGLTQKRICELMSLSKELAKLNHERYRAFELPFTPDNALPAAIAFDGEVYRGLNARSLAAADLDWSQDHLAILSGMFGLLRPLDLLQPYRLEMGTRLKTRRGKNLYDFWGDRIAKEINLRTEGHADRTLVNLASTEYFKAVKQARLGGPVVECVFEDWADRPDEGRVVGFLAKHARGLMARFIIAERLDRPAGLKDFALERYRYRAARSTDTRLVFAREFIPVAPPQTAAKRAAAAAG